MTLRQLATDWSLGIAFGFAVLYLNAYLDYRHPDAEALTTQVVADRAEEHVAMKGPK
jgi:hypothetical protein